MSATETAATVSATTSVLKNLAPDVFRQRLLVEGHFSGEMTEARVRGFLLDLAKALELRTYAEPIIFQPAGGMGADENAGFDAFVPLIDSGISAYLWTGPRFFSVVLYTCKGFNAETAIAQTREMLGVKGEIVAHSF